MDKSTRKRAATGALFGLTLIVLACTCGPLTQAQNLGGTVGAARGTIGSVATEFGQALPTIQAQLTDVGPTLEAALTEAGPTLNALQTQGGDLLPSLEAQLTQIGATPVPGATSSGGADASHQWAASATASSQFGDPDWSAQQAAGAPNTNECGDINTAWASGNANGVDSLQLKYAVPVTPKQIEIHETYNPSAVVKVEVAAQGGEARIVYEAPPTVIDFCPYVLVVPVSGVSAKIDQVTVYLDQSSHPGWNEIDAVELIGAP
jgi:hypothetical protein